MGTPSTTSGITWDAVLPGDLVAHVAHAEAAGEQRQDKVVEALQTPQLGLEQLRAEAALTVVGHRQPHAPVLGNP